MGIINSKKPNNCFRIGNVPIGTKTITSNGVYDVAKYANADVNVPQPSGTVNITSNGTHNVRMFESADVNVPQGVFPTGTKTITINGTYDVSEYANADVNVPSSGIVPTGTKNITANGDYDVTTYANAHVDVPGGGITPTGTKNIIANGDYDVTTYANAHVDIPNVITDANVIIGDFTYDGGAGYDLNLPLKDNNIVPYMVMLWNDEMLSSFPAYPTQDFKFGSAFAYPTMFAIPFSTGLNATWRTAGTSNTQSMSTSTLTNGMQFYTSNKVFAFPQALTNNMQVNQKYHYVIFYNTVQLDMTNAYCTVENTTVNIGETYYPGTTKIHDVDVYTNGTQLNGITSGTIATGSDNVIIDKSNIDTSTAGTYPLYITLSWNQTKTFTINITVV